MLKVTPFQEDMEGLWDSFVNNEAFNGTFLQTRRFLNYHPAGRFTDASLVIHNADRLTDIYAVVPACTYEAEGRKVFHSHAGSTYGGLVIHPMRYKVTDMEEVVRVLDDYLGAQYDSVILKNTPQLFSTDNIDLLEYFLWQKGYTPYSELSTYIDFTGKEEPISQYFTAGKRRDVKKLATEGYEFRRIHSGQEIAEFHGVLCDNLAKYDVTPVHTAEEMIRFETDILPDIVHYYGLYDGDTMVAGSMCFAFGKTNILHTQNLASLQSQSVNVAAYLNYCVLDEAFKQGFAGLSFGISTEDRGKYLNLSLIQSKERFGGKHTALRTYTKDF